MSKALKSARARALIACGIIDRSTARTRRGAAHKGQ